MEISHSCMDNSHSAWRFPIHAWDNSHSTWRFPIHAWTIPILNGDFMSILNGHEWTPEWDLPVAEWEIMARRPFTRSLQGGISSHKIFISTVRRLRELNGIKWKLRDTDAVVLSKSSRQLATPGSKLATVTAPLTVVETPRLASKRLLVKRAVRWRRCPWRSRCRW
jgi:hypothetical protein